MNWQSQQVSYRFKLSRSSLAINHARVNESSSKRDDSLTQSSRKLRAWQFIFRVMSNRSEFKNSWINDIKIWFIDKSDLFCIRCDHIDHIDRECIDEMLSAWKQVYLKEIVFDQSTQINFIATSFENHDNNIRSYENYLLLSSNFSSIVFIERDIFFSFTSNQFK